MGRNKRPTFDVEANTTATPTEVGEMMRSCLHFFQKSAVKTDEQAAERIVEYFNYCAENNSRPVWEELCMSLGVTRQTVNKWEHKQLLPNSERSDIIKNARQFMASFDAKLVSEGKMNPITYIYRSKNYYGMVDKQEHVIAPTADLIEAQSPEQIAQNIDVEMIEE